MNQQLKIAQLAKYDQLIVRNIIKMVDFFVIKKTVSDTCASNGVKINIPFY